MNQKSRPDSINESYQARIHDHIPFIEKQCFRAVRLHPQGDGSGNPLRLENEALELCNQVLDSLSRDDFRVMRNFKGEAKFTTYLTAIISRLAVDQIRRKRGRDRSRERARKFGDVGETIWLRIIKEGLPPDMVFQQLKNQHRTLTPQDFQKMVAAIAGIGSNPHAADPDSHPILKHGATDAQTGEIVALDAGETPEEAVIETAKQKKVDESLSLVLQQLSGEERLMLRMRFPFTAGEEPQKIERIAKILDISQKAVYKRIGRILKKCRKELENRGISIDDLL